MSTSTLSRPDLSPATDDALLGNSSPAAGLVCLFGFFLQIILSDPLLEAFGFHHSDNAGPLYERTHPGTLFIVLSFFILLAGRGRPVSRFFRTAGEHLAETILLSLVALLIVYMGLRSGGSGIAFMVDTHLTPPICAIVLCYTPLSYCRKALCGYILLAVINSSVGIAEGIGKFRIFTFDPTWGVLHEAQFRASAFLGHPLNNAMFTSIALFVMLALRIPVALKTALAALFLASLVAFGGRIGLVYSVVCCLLYVFIRSVSAFRSGRLTNAQVFLVLAAVITVPVVVLGGIYLLVNTDMGARLAAHSGVDDDSAQSRKLAFYVFDYMRGEEVLFGMASDRIVDIAYRMNLSLPLSDIENPWILMIMNLGAIMFLFWFVATLAFAWKLMRHRPLALKLAVLSYYIVASTSNSFGRKDSTYLIMVSAVVCAARVLSSPLPAAAGQSRGKGFQSPP